MDGEILSPRCILLVIADAPRLLRQRSTRSGKLRRGYTSTCWQTKGNLQRRATCGVVDTGPRLQEDTWSQRLDRS